MTRCPSPFVRSGTEAFLAATDNSSPSSKDWRPKTAASAYRWNGRPALDRYREPVRWLRLFWSAAATPVNPYSELMSFAYAMRRRPSRSGKLLRFQSLCHEERSCRGEAKGKKRLHVDRVDYYGDGHRNTGRTRRTAGEKFDSKRKGVRVAPDAPRYPDGHRQVQRVFGSWLYPGES